MTGELGSYCKVVTDGCHTSCNYSAFPPEFQASSSPLPAKNQTKEIPSILPTV